MSEKKMIRHRFKANPDDPLPVKFPPPGPYWISGYGGNHSIVIAFLPEYEKVIDYWPEAEDIESEDREIIFTDRFPCPEWYKHNDKVDD